jgi:WD40 repeat protein
LVVSGADDKTVRVADSSTGRDVAVFSTEIDNRFRFRIVSVGFSPDNRHVGTVGVAYPFPDNDPCCLVWDVRSRRLLRQGDCESTDAAAVMGTAPPRFRRHAVVKPLETTVEESTERTSIAWCPEPLEKVVGQQFGCMWAGSVGSDLYIFSLEGGDEL